MELYEAREYLREIPKINCGGCGVSALAIARFSKNNNLVDTPEFVLEYYTDVIDSRFAMKNNAVCLEQGILEDLMVPAHISVLLDSGDGWLEVFDCNTDCNIVFSDSCHVISEEVLLVLLNNPGWNLDFDRGYYIPEIEKNLGVNLQDVSQIEKEIIMADKKYKVLEVTVGNMTSEQLGALEELIQEKLQEAGLEDFSIETSEKTEEELLAEIVEEA